MQDALLNVNNLTTIFDVPGRPVVAVDDVSLQVRRGETLGLVGESGSGKSTVAFSILQLVPPPGRIKSGAILFGGQDLCRLPSAELRDVRGAGIGFVFQEPSAALSPVMRIGAQIGEALLAHGRATRREVRARAVELLRDVGIDDPDSRVDQYPHQLSGGLRQRAMLAVALACRPPLVMADEPTTALDATIQAQVLDLLRSLKEHLGLALLLITHDLGVIAQTADRVAVMYAGRIVEEAPVRDLFSAPLHPYTSGLLSSIPGERPGTRLPSIDGTVPRLTHLPPGCTFAPRCTARMDVCTRAVPALVAVAPQHTVRCYLHSTAAEPRRWQEESVDAGSTTHAPR